MSVFEFDDLDDLFGQMKRDQDAADNQVQSWQAATKSGDYVCRMGPGFLIYSEILEDPEPRDEGLVHYRFTRSYSIACRDGELGDIHVSTIESKLLEEDFQKAKERGWQPASSSHGNDPTEAIRRERVQEINIEPGSREALKKQYGLVWNTKELRNDFTVIGFMAPYCVVMRNSDGVRGSIEFQHNPRLYFNFEPG